MPRLLTPADLADHPALAAAAEEVGATQVIYAGTSVAEGLPGLIIEESSYYSYVLRTPDGDYLWREKLNGQFDRPFLPEEYGVDLTDDEVKALA